MKNEFIVIALTLILASIVGNALNDFVEYGGFRQLIVDTGKEIHSIAKDIKEN